MNENELLDVVIDAGLSKQYNTVMRQLSTKLARRIINLEFKDLTEEKWKTIREHAQDIFPKALKSAKFEINVEVDNANS